MIQSELKKLSFFKDSKGKIVIFQWPNVPLAAWLVLRLASLLTHAEPLKKEIDLLSMAVLLTWAYLEVISGVNYFRRILGSVVLVGMFIGFLTLK